MSDPLTPQSTPGVEFSVELGVGSVGDPNNYLYDDPTSLYDVAVYSSGEIAWTEIATRALSFQSNRGRDTWRDRFRAGTATVTLDNDDGIFNPDAGTAGPGALSLRVGRFLRVSGRVKGDLDWTALYVGTIEGITEAYPAEAHGVRTTFRCVDLMARLQIDNPPALGSPVPAERSDLRAARVLELAGWDPGVINADPGKYQVASSTLPAARLQEIQAAAQAEGGAFYFARDGVPTFRRFDWLEKGDREGSVQYAIGTGQGFNLQNTGASWQLGRVFNDIRYARAGGTEQRIQDSTSLAIYGQRTLTQFDFTNTTDSAVFELAERTLERQAFDVLRLGRLKVYPTTEAAARLLLETDVGWRLRVGVITDGGGPDAWGYVQDVWVNRIQHFVTGSDWFAELTVDNVDTSNPFAGGPYSRGYSTGYKVDEADKTKAPEWAAKWPLEGVDTFSRWRSAYWAAGSLDPWVAESFEVRVLATSNDPGSGLLVPVGIWAGPNTDRSWRVRLATSSGIYSAIFDTTDAAGVNLPAIFNVPQPDYPAGTMFWFRGTYDHDTGEVRGYFAPTDNPTSWTEAAESPYAGAAPNDQQPAGSGLWLGSAEGQGSGVWRKANDLELGAVEYWRGVGPTAERIWEFRPDVLAAGAGVPGDFGAWLYVSDGADPTIDLI